MTYEYQDLDTGEVYEVEQRITESAYRSVTPIPGTTGIWSHFDPNGPEMHPVKRLISRGAPFQLKSGPAGGWGQSGYSKPEYERKAEAQLGHPIRKAL